MQCATDSPQAEQREHSLETTAANTPASTDLDTPTGELVRLTPSNRLARLAFSQVVEVILHDPDQYTHFYNFVRFSKAGEEDGLSELSDLGEGVRAPSPPFRLWNGYYKLDLKLLPAIPSVGWILGSKSTSERGGSADLLLASKQGLHGVAGRHLRIGLNRDTGCLMVYTNGRNVAICGSFGTIKLKYGERALTEPASISIGDLQYDFTYQQLEEATYKRDLEHLMRVELNQTNFELSGSVSSLGSDTDIQLKDYTLKGTFAAGTSAMVAGAIVKATGQYVAVKKMRKTSQEDPTIAHEINSLDALHREHYYSGICRIREVIQTGRGVEETYIIYEPFLYGELYGMLALPILDDGARIIISRQYSESLSWIHGNGIMHRDLKPQNMGLRSVNPPDAVIFDFGHATFEETSMDHLKGTVWYLAPEVLDLKYRRSRTAYNRAVDVWAMGLTLYQLICRTDEWYGQEKVKDVQGMVRDYSLTRLDTVRQDLHQSKLTQTAKVVQQMLQVDPQNRIEAKEVWTSLSAQENPNVAFTASKRSKVK